MNLSRILEVIEGEMLTRNINPEQHFQYAFSSDMMSDVLTLSSDKMLLVTGLINLQTIRTAEMADIKAIVFARGKKPSPEMIELAMDEKIALIGCKKSMFHISGLLFNSGLHPVY